MNYFGLIFSFMVPGIIVGGMATALYYEVKEKKRAMKRSRSCHGPTSKQPDIYLGKGR